jgi:hypothetical protein
MARRPAPRPQGGGRPARDFAAEYARRKAKGAREGKSTQQARGHKPREHVARREREKSAAGGGLTSYEKQKTREFARQQAARTGRDPAEFEERALRWARENGYGAVKQARQRVKQLARQRTRRLADRVVRIEGRARNIAAMEEDAEDFGLSDWTWLYYH